MRSWKVLIYDKAFRKKLAAVKIDCTALFTTFLRIFKLGSFPELQGSFLKTYDDELYRHVICLNLEVIGPYSQSWYNVSEFKMMFIRQKRDELTQEISQHGENLRRFNA